MAWPTTPMGAWKELAIYQNTTWWGPREVEGVVSKKGHHSGFESYHVAYALAARELLEGAYRRKVVLPIAYMQRHSLEVAIKALTAAVYEFEAWEKTKEEVSYIEMKEPAFSHRYGELITEATLALESVGEKMPPSIEALAKDFDSLDGGHPDQMRYDRYKPVRKEPAVQSLKGNISIHILQRQDALESVLEEHFALDLRAKRGDPNLYTRLVIKAGTSANEAGQLLYMAGLL